MSSDRAPYPFADWRSGKPAPRGWDSADAVDDGWTFAELNEFIKDGLGRPFSFVPPLKVERAPVKAVEPAQPVPTPSEPPRPPVPRATPRNWPGVEGVIDLRAATTLQVGSEVDVSTLVAAQLRMHCGENVVYADARFWAFGPTDWREIEERYLRLHIHGYDGAAVIATKTATVLKVGKRMIDGVLAETGTILGRTGFFDDPAVGLNARNTVITIDAKGAIGTRPHDPDDRFRFTIPADFDLNTEMVPPEGSMLHRLISGAFRGDADAKQKADLVGEILGSAAFGMATRVPQPKAFILLGESANNGKSTVASLLPCLLPTGSVSSIVPASFADPARIVTLAGKAANVADEISGAVSGEAFKAAITGDTISGRDLYRPAITFNPRAIHVFTANKLPQFTGGLDRGLQRRLVVLKFERVIPSSEVIPDIVDRIKRDELDLLLGFAIAGAMRLVKNRAYTIPPSSLEAMRGWLMLDPVNEWFDARCKVVETQPNGGWHTTRDLFVDFKAWASDQGHQERHLPPVNVFSLRLKSLPGVSIKRTASHSVAAGLSCDFSAPLSLR